MLYYWTTSLWSDLSFINYETIVLNSQLSSYFLCKIEMRFFQSKVRFVKIMQKEFGNVVKTIFRVIVHEYSRQPILLVLYKLYFSSYSQATLLTIVVNLVHYVGVELIYYFRFTDCAKDYILYIEKIYFNNIVFYSMFNNIFSRSGTFSYMIHFFVMFIWFTCTKYKIHLFFFDPALDLVGVFHLYLNDHQSRPKNTSVISSRLISGRKTQGFQNK